MAKDNYLTNKYGLKPQQITTRICLKCDDKFRSVGPQNRLCDDCIKKNLVGGVEVPGSGCRRKAGGIASGS